MTKMRAREYLRVSADKSGRGASVAQQHAENERTAATNDWALMTPYSEPEAVSASAYSRKAREAFNELLDDIETGQFGADVLLMWESSRGSRRTGEWVDLIDVCAKKAVHIHVTTHGRTYDPRNARDRRTLLEDAIDSEYESAKLSGRVTRALAANATAGRPHGQIPYGYRRVYDERTGALVRQEPDPATADHVRELFDRVRRGDSIKSIVRDWDARGIRNKSGRPFGDAHLRGFLDMRAYIAERVHNGTVYAGDWEPLINRATWQAVRSIVTAPGRRTNAPARGKYEASMLARCGPCSGPLAGDSKVDGRHRTAPIYRCKEQHVTVSMADLDAYLRDVVAAYLARPDVHAALTAASTDSAQLQSARDRCAAMQGELDDLYGKVAAGALSAGALAAVEPGILARQAVAQADLERLQTPAALAGILDSPAGPAAALDGLTIERLRAVYGFLFTPDLLGVPHIDRAARKGPRQPPVHTRVAWRREAAKGDRA